MTRSSRVRLLHEVGSMRAPPIVSLRSVNHAFGSKRVLDSASIALGRGDRVCLVGRNGSGKSTLMKLLAGTLEPDGGERFVQPGVRVAWLQQEPTVEPEETVADFAARPQHGYAPAPHQIAAWFDRLQVDATRRMDSLSGGEMRRAALARVFAAEPDLLLLDEPTNHLDLPGIEWLEQELGRFPGALLVVSHDRTFLSNVTRRVCWLDRGRLRETERSFSQFDDWMEEILAEEEKQQARLNTKIAQETRWLHRGVTARRRRNQGRLARLQDMRAERASILGRPTRANLVVREGEVRSRTVIEAARISKSYPSTEGGVRTLVEDFSTRILRGDRIGILGPNGAGKSTLLRMLIGEIPPDTGSVKIADPLACAYFDQHRSRLDPEASLWDTLCPGGGDTVFVQGGSRHVVGYLKDFLFDADQVRSPVSTLSGGERNRLLLALILAQPSDLLVLDEPTNDLDMDTLDLLEEMLGDYGGTLLVVSHDRDFLDRLVTSVIAVEGDGRVREYAGGYTDYRRQRDPDPVRAERAPQRERPVRREARSAPTRLSYKEQRELDLLPDRIAGLEAEILKLETAMADPDLYRRDPELFGKATERLAAAQEQLTAAEEQWLLLEEKREALEAMKEP